MKQFLLLIAILSAFAACNTTSVRKALPDVKNITITPNWGDTKMIKLQLEKKRFTNRNGIRKSFTSYADIELQIDKGVHGTAIRW